jgi:hypothetical protein
MKKPPQSERVAALRSAPLNAWIALSEDETKIVATGATYSEVVEQLQRLQDDTSVIIRTPPNWLPLAV